MHMLKIPLETPKDSGSLPAMYNQSYMRDVETRFKMLLVKESDYLFDVLSTKELYSFLLLHNKLPLNLGI